MRTFDWFVVVLIAVIALGFAIARWMETEQASRFLGYVHKDGSYHQWEGDWFGVSQCRVCGRIEDHTVERV